MQELIAGTEVIFRDLHWEIVDARPVGEQQLFRLRGLEHIVSGTEIEILYPLEKIEPITHDLDPKKASPLQNWALYHQAFLLEQALGDAAILSVQPGRLKLEPYQIVPLMRALRMSRPRLLLCDDVGLGKTIQAALVMVELMARRLAHRVLIVSPAGPLLKQWKQELLERFGLKLEVIDREKVEEIRRKTELGANPFDHIPLGLASIDFLKQEKVLEQLERTVYDIVIIDEAHHCSDSGGQQEREDSLRRDLAKLLARKCDAFLILTATPHNGVDRSFASLLELLDTSLVNGKGVIIQDKYKPYVVRRLKRHIKDHETGKPKFKERKIEPVPVTSEKDKHKEFIKFQQELLNFIAPQLKSAFRSRRYGDVLAFIALLKRSVSSVSACLETLKVVRDRFDSFAKEKIDTQDRRRERIRTLRDYMKKVERFGVLSFEEEEDQKILQAEDIAEQLAISEKQKRAETRKITRAENIRDLLNNLIELASGALACDPKIEVVLEEVKKVRSAEPGANILIYTEYTDSQDVICKKLQDSKLKGKILKLYGGDDDKVKESATSRFCNEDNVILVSTDASAEGLNLQEKCRHLIHFELPFNPNRLEQRNGRIDRYGQNRNPIIRYLFLRDTFEDRILLRLIAKYERQKDKLQFVPDTLGISCSTDASCERLLKGIINEDEKLFRTEPQRIKFDFYEPEAEKVTDAGIKDLLDEIDKSFKGYSKALENNLWMSAQGVNAELELIAEAANANKQGTELTLVDLKKFVLDTVIFDGGRVKDGEIFEISLPPSWQFGLEGLPGYNPETQAMRLTVNTEITKDSDGNSVGFLGRSHPLVKKALDRVKNVGFTGRALRFLDPRISAVKADIESPQALFTFLGTISTKKEKIFEKVFAVIVDKTGKKKELFSPSGWAGFIDIKKAVNPEGLWERYFEKWAEGCKEKSLEMAKEMFKPFAERVIFKKKEEFEAEKNNIKEWFERRTEELTGKKADGVQLDLFEDFAEVKSTSWAAISDPKERLSKFCQDKNVLRARRQEAETLLRLYEDRSKDLDMLSSFETVTVKPLGILMVIPEGKGK